MENINAIETRKYTAQTPEQYRKAKKWLWTLEEMHYHNLDTVVKYSDDTAIIYGEFTKIFAYIVKAF